MGGGGWGGGVGRKGGSYILHETSISNKRIRETYRTAHITTFDIPLVTNELD